MAATLEPLRRPATQALSGAGRGTSSTCWSKLGTVTAYEARAQRAGLTADDRKRLARLDVRLGQRVIYVGSLLGPQAVRRRAALLRAAGAPGASTCPCPPTAGPRWPRAGVSAEWYAGLGYVLLGPRAIRADQLERCLARLRHLARTGPFEPPKELLSWLGCPRAELPDLLKAAGYREAAEGRFVGSNGGRRKGRRGGRRR